MHRFLLLCFLVPGLSFAGTIHRCVDPAGRASYQQATGCPAGHRLDRVIDYQPVPDSVPSGPSTSKAAPPRRAQRTATAARTGGTRTRRVMTDNERCRAAREKRDQALQKLGLKRTYADLGRLEEPVRAACRW